MLPCVGEDDLPRKAENSIDKIRYVEWTLAAKFLSAFVPLLGVSWFADLSELFGVCAAR